MRRFLLEWIKVYLTCAKAFDPEAVSLILLPEKLNQLTAQCNLASLIFFVDTELVASPQKVTVMILRR